jgi:uncharacterized protein involved in exopolysaccharide biosynthesis
MSFSKTPPAVAWSVRIYQRLIWLYPSAHRRDYGPAMVQLFRDQCVDAFQESGSWGVFKFWMRMAVDLGKSACSERLSVKERRFIMSKKPLLTRLQRRMVVAAFVLVILVVAGLTYIQPNYYASAARILVSQSPSLSSPGVVADGSTLVGSQGSVNPFFFQTEFEKLQSKSVLYSVIDKLNLADRWAQRRELPGKLSQEEVYQILRRSLVFRQYRNTSLIEIRALSEDREEAAQIANAIAQEYQEQSLRQLRVAALKGIDALEMEKVDQEKKVAQARIGIDTLRAENQIPDMLEGDRPIGVDSGELLTKLAAQAMEADSAYEKVLTTYSQLKELHSDQLRSVLPTAYPDTLLEGLLSRRNQADVTLFSLQKEGAESHPEVVAQKTLLSRIDEQIKDRISGILSGLELKMQIQNEQRKMRAESLELARKQEARNAKTYGVYLQAKRDLEARQQILQAISLKILQERVDSQLPTTAPVQLIDVAEPGLRPVRPNRPMNIVLGLLAGMLVSGLLASVFAFKGASARIASPA